MNTWIHYVFAPGLLQSSQVLHALLIGGVVAVISAVIGVFVVIRGQSFVGHVLTDIGAAGASGSFLIGVSAWYGFISFGVLAGTGVEILGDRARNRDIATGIILSFAMGLGALFLYFDTLYTSNSSAPMQVLFGSLFLINPGMVPVVTLTGLAALAILFVLYRPLLVCSVNPEIARTRGIPVRLVSILFMILLAVAVEDGSLVIGSLLSTALIIGPSATAIRLTSRLGLASAISATIGVVATCLGVLLAYDSYLWPPVHRGWPVSFFIAFLILLAYLLSRLWPAYGVTRRLASRNRGAV